MLLDQLNYCFITVIKYPTRRKLEEEGLILANGLKYNLSWWHLQEGVVGGLVNRRDRSRARLETTRPSPQRPTPFRWVSPPKWLCHLSLWTTFSSMTAKEGLLRHVLSFPKVSL